MTLELEEQVEKILARHLAVGFFGVKEMVDSAVVELAALVREREGAALIQATRGIELDIGQLFKGYAEADKEQPK